MAGIAIGHAAWSRKPGLPEMGLEGSSPSPVAIITLVVEDSD